MGTVKKVTAEFKKPSALQNVNGKQFKKRVQLLTACCGDVAPLCNSEWTTWSAPGSCQVCKKSVDKVYKGLHCTRGAHRICWKCMSDNIDWQEVVAGVVNGTARREICDLIDLDEINANLQCQECN